MALAGLDVVGIAKTGSGKTLATWPMGALSQLQPVGHCFCFSFFREGFPFNVNQQKKMPFFSRGQWRLSFCPKFTFALTAIWLVLQAVPFGIMWV